MKYSFLLAILLAPLFTNAQPVLQYDSALTDIFFKEDISVYPWWIAIDDSGRAASIFEEKVNLNTSQNRKRIATSKCVWFQDKDSLYRDTSYYYDSKARLSGDTLFLDFYYRSPPHYELWKAIVYKGQLLTGHESAPPERAFRSKAERAYHDSVEAINPFLQERVILNKRQYKKGDLLFAKIFLREKGAEYAYRYYGVLKCTVE